MRSRTDPDPVRSSLVCKANTNIFTFVFSLLYLTKHLNSNITNRKYVPVPIPSSNSAPSKTTSHATQGLSFEILRMSFWSFYCRTGVCFSYSVFFGNLEKMVSQGAERSWEDVIIKTSMFRIYLVQLWTFSTNKLAVSCRSESSNYKLGRFIILILTFILNDQANTCLISLLQETANLFVDKVH